MQLIIVDKYVGRSTVYVTNEYKGERAASVGVTR